MPDFLIKKMPAEIKEQLKKAAKEHQRSMSGQAIAILKEMLLENQPILLNKKPIDLNIDDLISNNEAKS